jgi:hypothetical protein
MLDGYTIVQSGIYGFFVTIFVFYVVDLFSYALQQHLKQPRPPCGLDYVETLYGMPSRNAVLVFAFCTFVLLHHFWPVMKETKGTNTWILVVVLNIMIPIFIFFEDDLNVGQQILIIFFNAVFVGLSFYILYGFKRYFKITYLFGLLALPFAVAWALYYTHTNTWQQCYAGASVGVLISLAMFGLFRGFVMPEYREIEKDLTF